MAMAQQHADPNANASLEQMIIRLPDSFAEALACKRRWLLDQAADDEILAAAARVARDTQFFWPSNFCLRINSLQAATWCVLSAMNLEAPWLAAHGCAQTAASFMGCLAACHTMQCSAISHDTRQLAWEGAQIGEQTFTRGVACPQAGNPAIERLATQALNATSADWWQRLNDDLTTALLQFAA
jgi:hypothetical protein